MSHQELIYGQEMRAKVKRGVDAVADAVRSTLGPGGKTVVISKDAYTTITKDGVSVAKSIKLEDKYENVGAEATIEAAEKANSIGGDGTTVATTLVQALVGPAFSAIDSGANYVALVRGIKKATEFVLSYLDKIATKINTLDQIKSVASISANDREMGEHIANLFHKLGKEGVIQVEESKGILGYEEEYVQGLQFDKGLASPYFLTDFARRRAEINNPYILLTDQPIEDQEVVTAFLERIHLENKDKKLVIIAADFVNDGITALIKNKKGLMDSRTKQQGAFELMGIKAPYASVSQLQALEDMAAVLGAKVISKEKGNLLPKKAEDVDLSVLGQANKVISDQFRTIIIGGQGTKKEIKQRIAHIRAEMKKETKEWEVTKLKERFARLVGQVAILRFGDENESISKEKKYRIEDSINATRNALEEGIVPGGEVAILKASLALNLKADGDEARGIEIVRQALQQPIKVLAQNAGESGNGVLKRVIEGQKVSKNFGWDAAKDEYGDMITKGIIDPLKVVKSAVQNASASVCLLLTTECIIKEVSEDKPGPLQRTAI